MKSTLIDEYISTLPAAAKPIIQRIREIIQDTVTDAEETIGYQMPAFRIKRIFIYFAAFKNHIGIYPPVQADADLEKALAPYCGPKGDLKFPLNEPMPYDLIKRVVVALRDQSVA